MQKIIFPCLLALLLLSGCSKDDAGREYSQDSYIESYIDLVITDQGGFNLLDPESGFRDSFEVVVYDSYGQEIVYHDPQRLYSDGYLIDGNDNSLRLFLELPYEGTNVSETYLRFDGREPDVFLTEFEIENDPDIDYGASSIVRSRIWLNGELIWDRYDSPAEYIHIEKIFPSYME